MLALLLANFQLIFALMILFAGSYSANVLLGTFYNVAVIKDSFNKERFLLGLARGGVLLVGLALIVIVVSVLPEILASAGLVEIVAIAQDLSLLAIAGIIGTATVKYLKGAVLKLQKIIVGEDYPSEEEVDTPESEQDPTT